MSGVLPDILMLDGLNVPVNSYRYRGIQLALLLRAENALHFALSKSQANAWLALEARGNLLPAQLRAACKK